MLRHVRMGLIVGAIGILANAAVSAVVGFCGPGLSMILGGVAGLLSVRVDPRPLRGAAARNGAIAGGIAGGLMIVGQLIGGAVALMFIQSQGTPLFGELPSDQGSTAIYYAAGLGIGLCFGVVGAALGAGAGALAGYLSGGEQAAPPPLSYSEEQKR